MTGLNISRSDNAYMGRRATHFGPSCANKGLAKDILVAFWKFPSRHPRRPSPYLAFRASIRRPPGSPVISDSQYLNSVPRPPPLSLSLAALRGVQSRRLRRRSFATYFFSASGPKFRVDATSSSHAEPHRRANPSASRRHVPRIPPTRAGPRKKIGFPLLPAMIGPPAT